MRNLINMPKKVRTVKGMREFFEESVVTYARNYAINIKVHRLHTTRKEEKAILAAMDDDGLAWEFSGFNDELKEFEKEYPDHRIEIEGRSGGYAVLYPCQLYNSGADNDEVRWLYALVWSFGKHVNQACLNFLNFATDPEAA